MDDPAAAAASLARLERLRMGMVSPRHGQPFGMEMLTKSTASAA
jgi:hypothetical protein